jgi:hypothetical protein
MKQFYKSKTICGSLYKLTTWTSPATGFSRSIKFIYDGTNWVESYRTAADIPNQSEHKITITCATK